MPQGYKVGGIVLPDAQFMIGAGVSKNPTTTKEWLEVAPVVSGSYTPLQRDGNTGKLFYPETLEDLRRIGFGLNAFGMPNMGFAAAAEELATITSRQPLIVSVAGFSVEDYVLGVETMAAVESVSAVELNFGCPNTDHGEIMSFKPKDLRKIFAQLLTKGLQKPIWVKLSPFSNPADLGRAIKAINDFPNVVRAVVTSNTIANSYAGEGTIVCEQTKNRGGLSGPALMPFARGQVSQIRDLLCASIDLIGAGGIMTADQILEYLTIGCAGVQMTSLPFWAGSPEAFWKALTDQETSSAFLNYNINNL